ncbi:MAG: sulfatase [Runella sp.]
MKKWVLTLSLAFIIGAWQMLPPAPTRPNIIFLLADDMRFDALGVAGNRHIQTPHLDQLAKQGYYFRNAFVTTSICCISRASILSGQYARRHGIEDFDTPFTHAAFEQTYPALLHSAGYFTGFIGKYGVGHHERLLPKQQFDFWEGYAGHGVYFMKQPNDTRPIHNTDWVSQKMEEFLSQAPQNNPFCLSVSFKAPHSEDGRKENGGFLPQPEFDTLYKSTKLPIPPTNQDKFYNQFPEEWKTDTRGKTNEGRVRYAGRFDSLHFQNTVKAYYRLVTGIDQAVGRLVAYLQRINQLQNTVILFTSDNGFYLGEHGLSDKWYGHNESIRVPLIIYDGRTPQSHKRLEPMVLNIDIAPTILQYAHVPIPSRMQGKPLQLLINTSNTKWRKEFFYEHRYDPGTYPVYIPMTEGIVSEKYKYMRYFWSKTDTTTLYEELFAYRKDSLETCNLVNESSCKVLLEEMLKKNQKIKTLIK